MIISAVHAPAGLLAPGSALNLRGARQLGRHVASIKINRM
jgi:hypothetical protein